jgi:subtilase family serine protease
MEAQSGSDILWKGETIMALSTGIQVVAGILFVVVLAVLIVRRKRKSA